MQWKIKEYEETCINRFGVKYAFLKPEARMKAKCSLTSKETQEKKKKTCIERYGVGNWMQDSDNRKLVEEKAKQTCLKKYRAEWWSQSSVGSQTLKSIYATDEYKKHVKIANIIKYGVEHWTQTADGQKKIMDIANSNDVRQKRIQTSLSKYGCQYPCMADEVKMKSKETCLEKYGVGSYFESGGFRQMMIDRRASINEKIYNTKKKNNSFNKSTPEDLAYKMLKGKFGDVRRQYKSVEYPFNCDFYIPSTNTYIEYNGFWTHGGHPFNQDDAEDIIKLKCWKSKHRKFYDNAVYVWTSLDTRKRHMANENKLDFIEFWCLDEVVKWCENHI